MFKKVLLIAGVLGAAVAFQSPAQADVHFSVGFGKEQSGHVIDHKPIHHSKKFHQTKKFHHAKKKHHGKGYKHALTNRELRYVLRQQGLRRIQIHSRHRGIAKVRAYNVRGYIARYKVSTKTGRILDGHVVRHTGNRGFHGRSFHHKPFHGHGHGHGRFAIHF